MSIPRGKLITCPKCGKQYHVTIFASLNTKYKSDVPASIIDGTLFDAKCPHCGYVIHLCYDFLYHDLRHKAMIYVVNKGQPDYQKRINEIMSPEFQKLPSYEYTRIVNSIDELREKVVCLETGRDDRAIELVKLFYESELKKQKPDFSLDRVFVTCTVSEDKSIDRNLIFYFYDTQGNSINSNLADTVYDTIKREFESHYESLSKPYQIIDRKWAQQFFDYIDSIEEECNRASQNSALNEAQKSGTASDNKSNVEAETNTAGNNITCSKCYHIIPYDSGFCPYCGAKVDSLFPKNKCEKCRKEIPSDSEFCPYCGNKLKSTEAEAKEGPSETLLCFKCGKPLQEKDAFCKHCGTKKGVDPQQVFCKNCNSPIADDSEYCPKCGAKNKQCDKRTRQIKNIIIASIIIAAIAILTVFAFPPIYRASLQKKVDRANSLANQRRFIEAYDCILDFEKKNLSSFGLDTDVEAYRRLKDYIEAGTYYEKGEYTIAKNMFTNLGDYRASIILADECGRLALSDTAVK